MAVKVSPINCYRIFNQKVKKDTNGKFHKEKRN